MCVEKKVFDIRVNIKATMQTASGIALWAGMVGPGRYQTYARHFKCEPCIAVYLHVWDEGAHNSFEKLQKWEKMVTFMVQFRTYLCLAQVYWYTAN